MIMRKRRRYLPLLLLVFLGHLLSGPLCAASTDWTERKLGKVIIKADKAARKKQWSRAIKYGERMLQGTRALDQQSDARYINLLKNLNRYYDRAQRLNDVANRVKEAYILSRQHLGSTHETTMMSRTLYYKFLMSNRDYKGAINLVLENISILGKSEEDDYRLLHYLKQLYSLYGITNQLEPEETTLLRYLEKSRELFGENGEDNAKVIWILAQNYCRQKKILDFNRLKEIHNLKYVC